ncbi:hypothetical protein [Hymenobacter lapidiphilus]|uniref:Leucine-rich repeat domain-containing protein n=1 Tax=Hymenobacter lapidiphilus TaxID=2608003 RepID=A0A7Y7U4Q5_9BACT|nr:hypothetical protein [Hymenobacter lapidiphilus]NVO29924.1 hypothetical protein [Hymenobacter lapidiphilus]
MKYILIKIFMFLPIISYAQNISTSRRKGIFDNLESAFKYPERVKLLDLRGKNLDSLSSSIAQFKNLEVLLLGSRLRNLWLYPRAWKYELRLKRLPAGGYAHLHGRGNGIYYLQNRLEHLPSILSKLTNMMVLDIRSTRISDNEGEEIEKQLLEVNPEINIIKESMNSEQRIRAKKYMLRYDIKYW